MVEADVMCMGCSCGGVGYLIVGFRVKPLEKWFRRFVGSAVNEAMINEYWKMKSAKVDKPRADQSAFCILQYPLIIPECRSGVRQSSF